MSKNPRYRSSWWKNGPTVKEKFPEFGFRLLSLPPLFSKRRGFLLSIPSGCEMKISWPQVLVLTLFAILLARVKRDKKNNITLNIHVFWLQPIISFFIIIFFFIPTCSAVPLANQTCKFYELKCFKIPRQTNTKTIKLSLI